MGPGQGPTSPEHTQGASSHWQRTKPPKNRAESDAVSTYPPVTPTASTRTIPAQRPPPPSQPTGGAKNSTNDRLPTESLKVRHKRKMASSTDRKHPARQETNVAKRTWKNEQPGTLPESPITPVPGVCVGLYSILNLAHNTVVYFTYVVKLPCHTSIKA